MATSVQQSDKAVVHARTFLQMLLGGYHPRNFVVRLWDGSQWPDEADSPAFTLVLKHPGALRRMFENTTTDLSLGEAYVYDDFDIEGDIQATFPIADYLMSLDWGVSTRLRLGWELLHLPGDRQRHGDERQAASLDGQAHSIQRDREAISYHYDVSNDF